MSWRFFSIIVIILENFTFPQIVLYNRLASNFKAFKTMNKQAKIALAKNLNEKMSFLSFEKRLSLAILQFKTAIFTTSLGLEDQVLTFAIANNKLAIKIITLETGRLFPQTKQLIKDTKSHFQIQIKELSPNKSELQTYIDKYGLNGFYENIEARKACCKVRKITPLKQALKNADVWITGLRSEQSNNRSNIPFAQYDESFDIIKINPLADVKLEQIWQIIKQNNIPSNPLHQKSYPSIGCEPCTKAIRAGEGERAGRWWWERDQKRECGLHLPTENQKTQNPPFNKIAKYHE